MNQSPPTGRLAFMKRMFQARRLDRVFLALSAVSMMFACIVIGAYMAAFDVKLYRQTLKPSFDGLKAINEKNHHEWKRDGWYKPREDKIGIGGYRPELAYNGLTVYSSMGSCPTAQLISMGGEVIHEWQLPFGKAWETSDGDPESLEERMHWRRVHLFPNGDLLAIYNVLGETPYGVGLVKLDKDSKLIWKYDGRVHHDFSIDRSGTIYALAHEIRRENSPVAPHLRAPMLEDFVVIISPEGKELRRIPVLEAFAKSKFRECLHTIVSNSKGDHTHTNDVEVLSEAFAKHHTICAAGDVLISLRNPSLLAILNIEREEIVWASRGIWEFQHDPDALDNGNLLIFDNQGNKGKGGKSRILEWNPETTAIEWAYVGDTKKPFETSSRGCQDLLPNGNVLITESNNGRLVEVTRDGKVAWEFHNPHRDAKKGDLVAVVYSAERYRAEQLTFLTSEQLAKARMPQVTVATGGVSPIRR
ncbi:MAG: hypothetical protein IT427_20775 [Pirellulales bacterium]|nr:hypothetical protein [Pirellulales bacterium]